MAKARLSPAPEKIPGVTLERAVRLCRMIRMMSGKGLTRSALLQRLKLDVRGFYRDLETLARIGVVIELKETRYILHGNPAAALQLMPFPDPQLTLGEAQQLSKGRSAAHRKLQLLLRAILPAR
jgi:predicted DNA-binding transcriptional regulator YafY